MLLSLYEKLVAKKELSGSSDVTTVPVRQRPHNGSLRFVNPRYFASTSIKNEQNVNIIDVWLDVNFGSFM